MSEPGWLGKYVGIPFVEQGSSFKGCHCWGLNSLVLRTEAGVQTPDYAEISGCDLFAAARAFRGGIKSEIWTEVKSDFRTFDCVLMRAMTRDGARLESHTGILVSPDRVLHVWVETSAVHMALDHPRLRNKIIGFYRHRNLT